MAFGTATVLTSIGKAVFADRVRVTPATYTSSPRWGAIGKGATGAARTAVVGDTVLSCEMYSPTAGSNTTVRSSGVDSVQTTTVTNDTYKNVGTIVASSASSSGAQAVDEAGLFDTSSSGAGNMFTSATFPVVNLFPGDSLQNSWLVQLTALLLAARVVSAFLGA